MLRNSYDEFIEAVALVQGVEIGTEECRAIARSFREADQEGQRLRYKASFEEGSLIIEYEVSDGQVVKAVFTIAIGFIGGGWVGAAIALGSVLFQKKNRPGEDTQEEQVFNQTRGFSNGGKLISAGQLIPVAYGSRSQTIDAEGNVCGGVRAGGFLLNSRIDTDAGRTFLYQLWGVGVGEDPDTGCGIIQQIDANDIYFDNQPRKLFGVDEINVLVRAGSLRQSGIPWFPNYSQNVTLSNFSSFGIDLRTKTDNDSETRKQSARNGENVVFDLDNGDISKSSNEDNWDSNAWSDEAITGNGFLSFESGQRGATKAIGLAGFQGALEWGDLAYGFYFNSRQFAIVENGIIVRAFDGSYNESSRFRIEITNDATRLAFLMDERELHVSNTVPPVASYANVVFFSSDSRFNSVRTSQQTGGIKGEDVYRTSFQTFDRAGFNRMNAGDNYVLANGQPGIDADEFKIYEKSAPGRIIETDKPTSIDRGTDIYAWWNCVFETSKHVNIIDLNMVFNVFSRDQDRNLVTFGVMFDIWIRRADQEKSEDQRIGRFYVRSNIPVDLYRSLRIQNLPLGRYIIEIRPQTRDPGDEDVRSLTDFGNKSKDDTSAVFDGFRAEVVGEFENISQPNNRNDDIDREMSYEERSEVSSNRGPTGKLISINEIVDTNALEVPATDGAHTYPGLALIGTRYQPSERIQRSLALSAPVNECRAVRNLMAAGTSSGLSASNILSDPTASFNNESVRAGWILRNLTKKTESRITSFTPTSIVTEGDLNWRTSDRYLVFFKRASPFLPDNAADHASSKNVGVGEYVDFDTGIEFTGFVKAREFNKINRLYWNGFVQDPPTPFNRWFNEQARSALLFDSRVNGRLSLIPEELFTGEPLVFNDSNSSKAKLSWPSFESQVLNRLIIRYTDMRDRPDDDGARGRTKTVLISTLAASLGTETPVEQVLDLPNATSPLQCIQVGTVFFNSARLQTRGISFEANMSASEIQGASIISHQFASHEVGEEYSGFVTEADERNSVNGSQAVKLNTQPLLFEGLASSSTTDGPIFERHDLRNTAVSAGDLIVNRSKRSSAIITNVAQNQITASIPCESGDIINVMNLTASNALSAAVTFRESARPQNNLSYSYENRDGEVWLIINGLAEDLKPIDPVNIGIPSNLYRVQKIDPIQSGAYRITAAYYPGEALYSSDGLVFEYDGKRVTG